MAGREGRGDGTLDVFVGNLTFTTTEEQLREVFGVVGTVKNVRILMDKETQRPKGYAFVEYGNIDSVHAAVRLLDKTDFNGRMLRVSFASGTPAAGGGIAGGPAGGGGMERDRERDRDGYRDRDQNGYRDRGAYDADAGGPPRLAGTIAAAAKELQLHEAWDLLDTMKRLNDEQRLRPVLEAHPQLVAVAQELQRKLGLA